jgi:NACalpha-BTF3-like transcription factor
MWLTIIQTITEPSPESLIGNAFEQYGPLGIGLGVLLTLMFRQNKSAQVRIESLEKQQEERYDKQLADQKEMIEQYVELVQNQTKVLSDLTNCLNAMKDTLERMERTPR